MPLPDGHRARHRRAVAAAQLVGTHTQLGECRRLRLPLLLPRLLSRFLHIHPLRLCLRLRLRLRRRLRLRLLLRLRL